MKRMYQTIISSHFDHEKKMVFIAGPRQVGKTTTSRDALPKALYLNWDNSEHRAAILKGPTAVFNRAGGQNLHQKKLAVVFDELHKFRNWKTFIKGLYDTYADTVQICVTGSARLNVFKHGGDSLMGRYFLYRMHPLSIREAASALPLESDTTPPSGFREEAWRRLLQFGGYPEPFLRKDIRFHNRWKRMRLDQLFTEDVREVSQITDIKRIRVLADLLIKNCCGLTNYSHLANDIQASVDTVRRWIDVMESLYFCFRIRPYSKNLARSILKEPKTFLWDWSLVADPARRHENFVASHLLKTVNYYTDAGLGDYDLWYVRDKEQREVDFLVTKDGVPWMLCEVKSRKEPPVAALDYFKKRLNVPHVFQCDFETPFVDADCFARTGTTCVPARTLLSQMA